MPKKEKISGAVRGRKDKRLQILAVKGGNLCWKTLKCSETRFSSYDVGSVFVQVVHVGMLEFGVHTDDEKFLWVASCRACLKTLKYDKVMFSIVLI